MILNFFWVVYVHFLFLEIPGTPCSSFAIVGSETLPFKWVVGFQYYILTLGLIESNTTSRDSHPSIQDLQSTTRLVANLGHEDGIPESLPQCGDWLFFSFLPKNVQNMPKTHDRRDFSILFGVDVLWRHRWITSGIGLSHSPGWGQHFSWRQNWRIFLSQEWENICSPFQGTVILCYSFHSLIHESYVV